MLLNALIFTKLATDRRNYVRSSRSNFTQIGQGIWEEWVEIHLHP